MPSSSSLELALADIELLQAAYPEEVQQVVQDAIHETPKFPLQCQVYLESTDIDQQLLQQQQLHRQQVSQVTLEWNEGYPISSGIQVASYRFSSSSASKARMDTVLAAIKQESEQCQQDEMEGGLACVAAALRAWNEFQDGNNHGAHHQNSNGDEAQQKQTAETGDSSTTLQQQSTPSYSWMSGQPLLDRKSAFQAHVCRVESEQQVHQALDQLLTSHSKLQRATHNMYAYRLMELSKGRWILKHDNDDDGEDGAGSRMAQLLQSRNEQNVLVVVSRWFGGIQLGPKRFAHITNVARDVLVAWHDDDEDDKEQPGWNNPPT